MEIHGIVWFSTCNGGIERHYDALGMPMRLDVAIKNWSLKNWPDSKETPWRYGKPLFIMVAVEPDKLMFLDQIAGHLDNPTTKEIEARYLKLFD